MSNDLTPVPAPDSTPALVPPDPFKGQRKIAVFLNQDSPERVAQLGRAIAVDLTNWPDDLTAVDAVGVTIWARKVSKHDDPVDKDGVYVCVHCKDGSNWITASRVVLAALPQLVPSIGEPPWPDGQTLTIGKIHKQKGDLGRCVIAAGDVSGVPSF